MYYKCIYIHICKGIIESKAGYSGGSNTNPTYKTVCSGIHIYNYMYIHVYIHVYIYIYIYVYIYVYIYK
jgi:hypothetical protein